MENTNINNGTDPTAVNQTTVERTERNKYKIPILSDRETDLSKTNTRMWWEQISEYIDLTYQKKLEELIEQGTDSMDPHTTYHIKGDVIWALGPKAKHEIMRGQWGKELKDIRLQDFLRIFKKTFLPIRNVFHSRAQFFNIKQEDGETLDEYWKRLVDVERKCEFNTITPEDIITYKFAASINDKKAKDKFIKGPLKLQLILETIELDNYNRKYGINKAKQKDSAEIPRKVHPKTIKSDIQHRQPRKKPPLRLRRKLPRETAISAERPTGHPNISARHGKLNTTIAKSRDTLPKPAEPKP